MSKRRAATFRERDMRSAIRAARSAGEPIECVEITRDGVIRVLLNKTPESQIDNEWDAR